MKNKRKEDSRHDDLRYEGIGLKVFYIILIIILIFFAVVLFSVTPTV